MKNLYLLLLAAVCFSHIQDARARASWNEAPKEKACPLTREFVATFEYLKKSKRHNYLVGRKKEIAMEVSKGCKDAAKRFINIDGLLSRFDVPVEESIKRALKYSKAEPYRFEIFKQAFSNSFARDRLSINPKDSYNIADGLAWNTELKVPVWNAEKRAEQVVEDFEEIVGFCLDKNKEKKDTFASSDCVGVARSVAIQGGNRSDEWIKIYNFVTSKEGPSLESKDAIEVASHAIKDGEGSFDNFKYAYYYGVSKNGLSYSKHLATRFALSLSQKSSSTLAKNLKNPKSTETQMKTVNKKKLGVKRIPASK